MAQSITQSFVKQYEREVHHVFQRQGGILRPTVRLKMGVIGKDTTFQVIGKGAATQKARHGVITPMNQDHTPVPCPLVDRYAGDWVDKLDETKINHDEREAIAKGGAWAIGRAIDNDIITELDTTSQSAVTYTYTNVGTMRGSLITTLEALSANDVPNDGQRYVLLTPRAYSAAMAVPEFSSADFVNPQGRPFIDGMPFPQWRMWMGAFWTQHTGLPNVGLATAKGFAYHKTAVGYAMNPDITADITWHGDRAAHFVNHMFSGGACLIEDPGVIELDLDDTASIPA